MSHASPSMRRARHAAPDRRPPGCIAAGFTIVETVVVLTVIALVIGAVFVGRDLVTAMQIRSVVNQFGEFDSAVLSFRAKYGGLPGDLADAAAFGLAEAGCPAAYVCDINGSVAFAGCNGNGNERLDDGDDPPSPGYMHCPENLSFWYHLAMAGSISGDYDGKATSAGAATLRTPVFGVSAPATRLRDIGILTRGSNFMIGHNDAGTVTNQYQLTSFEAHGLDVKLDDGMPLAGSMKAWGLSFTLGCYGPSPGPALPMVYRVDHAAGRCILTRPIPGFRP